MSRCPLNDFELGGFSSGRLVTDRRRVLFTFDVEAFLPDMMPAWLQVFRVFRQALANANLPVVLFLATEDLVRLRHRLPDSYAELGELLAGLQADGSELQPHNHFVFDPLTGLKRPAAKPARAIPAASYDKRKSFFHHVVYEHGLASEGWLAEVAGTHAHLLSEMQCPITEPLVFRAGGWDYGMTSDDHGAYIAGLKTAGFSVDSSVGFGRFGTREWRIGNPYGCNCHDLGEGLIEIAPCWSWSAETGPLSIHQAGTWRALLGQRRLWLGKGGILVVVLHLDHLLHRRSGRTLLPFAISDPDELERRTRQLVAFMRDLAGLLRLQPTTFGHLPCLTPVC